MKKKSNKKQKKESSPIEKIIEDLFPPIENKVEEHKFGTPEHTKQWLENEKKKSILKTTEPSVVQEALQGKASVDKDKTTLSFDTKTGQLIVSSDKIEGDDNVVVDQIYKDGFFSKKEEPVLELAY